jgi:hypothetical protein
MIGDAEGVGEVVTGGMLARAVEPHAGEKGGEDTRCLNCGTELFAEYCHSCGQRAHVHRSLAAIGHDLAHSVAHFEGKTWRTLPLLAWRPGELTRRYIEGERARFVSPMALFLFSVFLMFAVFSMLGGPSNQNARIDRPATSDLESEHREAQRELQKLEARRDALAAGGKSTATVDDAIDDARAEAAALGTVAGMFAPKGPAPAKLRIEGISPGWLDWLNAVYAKARENPALLAYKLQSNAYKFSWALIPISVPFLWLLFLFRRQYRLYDHTVFVTYSISFMTLFVILISVADAIGLTGGWMIPALVLVPPLHMYRQLRGAYRLSRGSALWRAACLSIFALLAGLLFFLLLVTIGIT